MQGKTDQRFTLSSSPEAIRKQRELFRKGLSTFNPDAPLGGNRTAPGAGAVVVSTTLSRSRDAASRHEFAVSTESKPLAAGFDPDYEMRLEAHLLEQRRRSQLIRERQQRDSEAAERQRIEAERRRQADIQRASAQAEKVLWRAEIDAVYTGVDIVTKTECMIAVKQSGLTASIEAHRDELERVRRNQQ